MKTVNAGIEPELYEYVAKTYEESPYYKLLGISLEEVGPKYAIIGLDASPELTNALGIIHGGVIMALADSAMGNAIRAAGLVGITADISVSLTSSPKIGEKIRARGEVVKKGKNLIFTEGKVFSDDKVVAYGKGTFFRTKTIEFE